MNNFIEKYTRSSFKQKDFISKFERKLLKESLEKENFLLRKMDGSYYSHEESMKLIKCMLCDKYPIDNFRRYCINCEFYVDY